MANEKDLKKIRNLYDEIAGRIDDINKKEKALDAGQQSLLNNLEAIVAKYADTANIADEEVNLSKAALQTAKAVSKNLNKNNILTRMGLKFAKMRVSLSGKLNDEEKEMLGSLISQAKELNSVNSITGKLRK